MGVDPPYYQRDIALIPKLLDFHTGTRTQTHTHIASYGVAVHLKRGYREVCILNYHSLQILRYIQPIGRTCNPPPPNLTRTHMKADGLVHLKILYEGYIEETNTYFKDLGCFIFVSIDTSV